MRRLRGRHHGAFPANEQGAHREVRPEHENPVGWALRRPSPSVQATQSVLPNAASTMARSLPSTMPSKLQSLVGE